MFNQKYYEPLINCEFICVSYNTTSPTIGSVADIVDDVADEGVGGVNKGVKGSDSLKWDSWKNYEKVTVNGQEYAKVGDRLYSKHAVNRMQPSGNRFGPNIYQAGGDYGRSIAPNYVEDVIKSNKPVFQPETGNYMYISGSVKVITNSEGAVVTVMTYR